MIQRFDHVTVVVRDLERARTFFGLLGFVEDKAVVIKGPMMDAYMGVPGLEADHVTLVLRGVTPRLEVQILRYRHPEPLADPNIERLEKVGFNHAQRADGLPLAQADLRQGSGGHHGGAVAVGRAGAASGFRSTRLTETLRDPSSGAGELSSCVTHSPESPPGGRRTGFGGPTPPERSPAPAAPIARPSWVVAARTCPR